MHAASAVNYGTTNSELSWNSGRVKQSALRTLSAEGVSYPQISPVLRLELTKHQIDLLHEEKESVGLGNKRDELVVDVKISSAFFGIDNYGPGGYQLRSPPGLE